MTTVSQVSRNRRPSLFLPETTTRTRMKTRELRRSLWNPKAITHPCSGILGLPVNVLYCTYFLGCTGGSCGLACNDVILADCCARGCRHLKWRSDHPHSDRGAGREVEEPIWN